jgi:hypothetical protein
LPALHERDARAHIDQRYNTAVPAGTPEPQPDHPSVRRPGRYHIFKLEAVGLLIIGALILTLILVRYWHHIAWGAR